jgi:hypothetical protein
MSASIARRRKQLAAKAALASQGGQDPITEKMNSLLIGTSIDEATAYEALQLAQSQLRKCVKSGEFTKATVTYGYDVCLVLLQKHGKASVASQLLALLSQVLTETHTACDTQWIVRIQTLAGAYCDAVKVVESAVEQKRLYRLLSKFLKTVLGWSDLLGDVTLGALEIHELIADHSWFLSESAPDVKGNKNKSQNEEDDGGEEFTKVALQSESVTHYALAENPIAILEKIKNLPDPTNAETKVNHICPPSARESLLTRAVMAFITMENIRDAHSLLTMYIDQVETRDLEGLKKSYMSKTDKRSPNHIVFLSMLLSIVRKDKKTGPLYNWLLKGFSNAELVKMYKPEMLKGYTTKIGKVYFDIQPPPGMLASLESMMGMMGGGGVGGMPGGGGGGMNPAMMQQMAAMMGGMQ